MKSSLVVDPASSHELAEAARAEDSLERRFRDESDKMLNRLENIAPSEEELALAVRDLLQARKLSREERREVRLKAKQTFGRYQRSHVKWPNF